MDCAGTITTYGRKRYWHRRRRPVYLLMKILNLGSLNIDHVYAVETFVRPGETIASTNYARFAGGKGLNQSIALGRAGATVIHAGKIGSDGEFLRDVLRDAGVDTGLIQTDTAATGHAIIQVAADGENAIIVEGGANHRIDEALIARALDCLEPGDWLLLQNEINDVAKILEAAKSRGARTAYNPAPMLPATKAYPLRLVDTLIVNETEGHAITGCVGAQAMTECLVSKYRVNVVVTSGDRGAMFADFEGRVEQAAEHVNAIDTTAAGDTFIGYYLAAILEGNGPQAALRRGCAAAAICVTRNGAADSIPRREEVPG